ncbi:MAG: hypothetical protein LBH22_08300 [Bacteroidales bacterium]|jgi:predicted nucleic acid-binding Zn ribbon protein|nr:hypothetical protein [Bacteroidales bacterium]
MGSFFNPPKLRKYDMKPRYYSEEKERIDELKRRVGEEAAEGEERSERIKEAFERKRSRRRKPNKLLSGSRVLIYLLLVVLLVMLISNTRFLLF